MNWKDYEKEIYQQFKDMYPTAEITYDAKVLGRYSKVDRQIDILVEDYAAGESITIMVDAKFFGIQKQRLLELTMIPHVLS